MSFQIICVIISTMRERKTAIQPVIDPRGKQKKRILKLARRCTLDELRKGPLLFFDNAKLSYSNYGEIFTIIKEKFTGEGISNFTDFRKTVRGKSARSLKNYALRMAKTKPAAAVVALGDMGVSPATTIIAVTLEELGIPCVYITAPPGAYLAEAVAFYRAGQLCLCPVDVYQDSTPEDIRREIDRQWDCIVESLTLPPERIGERSKLDFELDAEVPASNGLIELTDKIKISETSALAAGIEEVTDFFNSLHIGDGLPVIPPTKERYHLMLTYCPFVPNKVLARNIGPSGENITVKDVAVAAIMAGCKPEYLPILITVFKAMSNNKYNFSQSVTTSHPGGNLVLVSGPIAKEVGIWGGQGCLGPGFPANATIGRAVNLAIINVCRSVPGFVDLACLSSQAEWTYCFAEDPELSPWPTINAERYDANITTVYVLKAEVPHAMMDLISQTSEGLLGTFVDCCTTLGSNNAYFPGNLIMVITPNHARLLNREGWNKDKIREHIFSEVCNEVEVVRNRGIVPSRHPHHVRPAGFKILNHIPIARSPKDIEVIVAGGEGGHSAVILPWALHSEAIIEPVVLPDNNPARSIREFRRKV
ncbi:hypothetical protein ACFLXP_01780 [Chloroflexota bacterium]